MTESSCNLLNLTPEPRKIQSGIKLINGAAKIESKSGLVFYGSGWVNRGNRSKSMGHLAERTENLYPVQRKGSTSNPFTSSCRSKQWVKPPSVRDAQSYYSSDKQFQSSRAPRKKSLSIPNLNRDFNSLKMKVPIFDGRWNTLSPGNVAEREVINGFG